jgi:hypothetical protein
MNPLSKVKCHTLLCYRAKYRIYRTTLFRYDTFDSDNRLKR